MNISTKSRREFRDEFLRLARARISLLLLHTAIQDKQFAIRFSMCPCMYDMNFFFIDFFIGITCELSIVYFVLFSFFIPFMRESVSPLDYKG